ncbi:6PGL phosphogluconolactonase, partial [Oxylabes madagascariensis]|nr:6PGL phosphogluconolactonase [Oxylabes madagascariensis]
AALARSVTEAAAEAVASGGRFTLGLSGGSLVPLLARELPPALSAAPGADPSRWLVAFCDERLVPVEDPESTEGAYRVRRGRGGAPGGAPGVEPGPAGPPRS